MLPYAVEGAYNLWASTRWRSLPAGLPIYFMNEKVFNMHFNLMAAKGPETKGREF